VANPSRPDPLSEIEATQKQLRENIAESKQLVDKADRLLKKMKDQRSK
jgi:hypothetical protein